MRTLFSALFPLVLCIGSQCFAAAPFSLSGKVVNTTNPAKQITASATISFNEDGNCVIRIDAPLYGSGLCSLQPSASKDSGITIISVGPSGTITWKGVDTQAGYVGAYHVDYPDVPQLPEQGTFAFDYDPSPKILHLEDVLPRGEFVQSGQTYRVVIDRDIAYLYDGASNYRGLRFILDENNNPIVRIEDHKDGSLFVDLTKGSAMLEWHTDSKDGYYSKTKDGLTSYYDRYMNYTSWSSINAGGQTIYLHEDRDSVELYDASFKSLNIRSGKTSAGKVYWMKTENGLTEYYDDSMNPLHWYSMKQNGETYYAQAIGKKVKVYDSNLHQLHGRPGFWRRFGQGFALGLAAYGQALQTQASQPEAQPNTSYQSNTEEIGNFGYTNTTGSNGSSYTTTTQRIGNFDYSTTTGSNGYYASTTRQQIGNFDYINGHSSNGSISGTGQQIGNFNYSQYMTPAGNWNGTSQQIGNFTYHTITAPDGTVHTGTTQRIGDFLYTSIH